MFTDPAFWKFFRYWITLDGDRLKFSKDKHSLVKYSDELLLDMIGSKGPIDPKAFKFNKDACTYTFKYLNCTQEEKTNKIS
jgi:hypothetical protein